MSKYQLLDKVNYPSDLKQLSISELKTLAEELRQKTIETVSETGGHLGAGLGVIELTVALHYVFDTPNDRLVWDIGHQTYPHKILTGRKEKMHTLRKKDGLSGFTKIKESIYDCFGAGHCSTSISAALGMAVARDLKHEKRNVVAVIGDGSISAGMAYEALNNAGDSKTKLIVILNNNDMSIARPVGAMSNYLSKVTASKTYLNFRNMAKHALEFLPSGIEKFAKKTEQYFKNFTSSNDIFDDLGFYSIGPIDGHNLEDLIAVLNNIKNDESVTSPFLVHIVTEKGKGFNSPQGAHEKYHAVSKFNLETGEQKQTKTPHLTYTKIFSQALVEAAKIDENIVAITAAMPSGTGLDAFNKQFPERTFDVGIAEQHAVTFAAGLAYEGMKPFCTIYSTFLQRGYDQVVHDVAIQNLPVKFAMDRAGLVGADGPTHAGSFDISYLSILPNFVVMAPKDGLELAQMVKTASNYNQGPIAFRYPRGDSNISEFNYSSIETLEIGKGEILHFKSGNKIAILSLGTVTTEALKAYEILKNKNIEITVVNMRFAKPIDVELLANMAKLHKVIITLEEGSIGGFSAQIMHELQKNELLDNIIFRSLYLPDTYIEQGTQEEMLEEAKLDANSICEYVTHLHNKSLLKEEKLVKEIV